MCVVPVVGLAANVRSSTCLLHSVLLSPDMKEMDQERYMCVHYKRKKRYFSVSCHCICSPSLRPWLTHMAYDLNDQWAVLKTLFTQAQVMTQKPSRDCLCRHCLTNLSLALSVSTDPDCFCTESVLIAKLFYSILALFIHYKIPPCHFPLRM